MKPPAYYKKKEQTYLKHFFLERYLETVAFHIGYTHREFVYVDCFSRPWRSADESLADTSIRIALDKLNYVREALAAQGRPPTIRAIFIEKDPGAFRALQIALKQHSHSIKTTALPGAFEDNIPAILEHVGKRFASFLLTQEGGRGSRWRASNPYCNTNLAKLWSTSCTTSSTASSTIRLFQMNYRLIVSSARPTGATSATLSTAKLPASQNIWTKCEM